MRNLKQLLVPALVFTGFIMLSKGKKAPHIEKEDDDEDEDETELKKAV